MNTRGKKSVFICLCLEASRGNWSSLTSRDQSGVFPSTVYSEGWCGLRGAVDTLSHDRCKAVLAVGAQIHTRMGKVVTQMEKPPQHRGGRWGELRVVPVRFNK